MKNKQSLISLIESFSLNDDHVGAGVNDDYFILNYHGHILLYSKYFNLSDYLLFISYHTAKVNDNIEDLCHD